MSSRDNTSRGDNVIRADFGRKEPVIQEVKSFDELAYEGDQNVESLYSLPDLPMPEPLPPKKARLRLVLLRRPDGATVYGGEFEGPRPVNKALKCMRDKGIDAEGIDFGLIPFEVKRLYVEGQLLKRCSFPKNCSVHTLFDCVVEDCVFKESVRDYFVVPGTRFRRCKFVNCDFTKAMYEVTEQVNENYRRTLIASFHDCEFIDCVAPLSFQTAHQVDVDNRTVSLTRPVHLLKRAVAYLMR